MDELREAILRFRVFKIILHRDIKGQEAEDRKRIMIDKRLDEIMALIDSYSREARIDELELFWNEETGLGDYQYILERTKTLKEGKAPRQFLTGAEKRLWEQAEVDDAR